MYHTQKCAVWLVIFFGDVFFNLFVQRFIAGIVYLRALDPELDVHTFAAMLKRRVTFAEALADDGLDIIAKQRLVNVRRAIFKQLDPLLA